MSQKEDFSRKSAEERKGISAEAQKLSQMLHEATHAVFFGGAGVSCESGIPDFRSADGLYHGEFEGMRPEQVLHASYFSEHTESFYRFYRTAMLHPDARPNPAHFALARWEREGRLSAVITQNIDGLHQMAGSRRVLELHGSVHRNRCLSCGAVRDLSFLLRCDETVPHCPLCGGRMKPDVVLYGEALPAAVFRAAEEEMSQADLVIVAGTSLTVQPAASLLTLSRPRSRWVLINLSETPADRYADLVIRRPVGQVLAETMVHLPDSHVAAPVPDALA